MRNNKVKSKVFIVLLLVEKKNMMVSNQRNEDFQENSKFDSVVWPQQIINSSITE